MPTIRDLNRKQREETLERTLRGFLLFCERTFGYQLYDYQIRIARACLSSIIVEPKNICIKLSRQSGKTECITLLVRFLIIFYLHLTGTRLMAAFASPKGEQAKTDLDRIKQSIADMRTKWHIMDKEFNAHTVRAHRYDRLHAEIFRFSLGPTTSNESKTLNLLIIEESHKIDDAKRSNELDPMLASTGGVTWMIGVGCPQYCDFKKGCDGELPNTEAIIVPVDEVIADRRKRYEETGDPKHLEYEKAYQREVERKGTDNPEIRMNYLLDDIVEVSNFVSRERLLSCARSKDKEIKLEKLGMGVDWARESDETIVALATRENDIVGWWRYPHIDFEEQIEMMLKDLESFRGKVVSVRSDATSEQMATERLSRTWLPCGPDTKFKFTLQSKSELYANFEQALFKDSEDSLRLTYPPDHKLTHKFEEQMLNLVREYKGDGEYLSVHHPDEPGAKDDTCDAVALALLAAKEGGIGDIRIL